MTDDVDDEDAEPEEQATATLVVEDTRDVPVRFHHLRAIGQSPQHAHYAFHVDGSATLSKLLGSGTHAVLFNRPHAVWNEPAIYKTGPRKGEPTGKLSPRAATNKKWIEFQALHRDSVIMTPSEMLIAEGMVTAIRSNREAAQLLGAAGLRVEETIYFPQLGRKRRSTPDLWTVDDLDLEGKAGGFVAELKTTRCANPFVFWRDVKRYSYHAQIADQGRAIAARTGKAPRSSYIIAVESSPPHVVQVYRLPWTLLESGEQLCSMWLDRLLVVEAAGQWSMGYAPGLVDLEFPDFGAAPVG